MSRALHSGDQVGASVAVTPSDSVDLPRGVTLSIYVGATGDIKMTMASGDVVVRTAVPVGEWPWQIKRIWNTATTASNILADYLK